MARNQRAHVLDSQVALNKRFGHVAERREYHGSRCQRRSKDHGPIEEVQSHYWTNNERQNERSEKPFPRLLRTHRGRHRVATEKGTGRKAARSEEHTSELPSRGHLVCRLLP